MYLISKQGKYFVQGWSNCNINAFTINSQNTIVNIFNFVSALLESMKN